MHFYKKKVLVEEKLIKYIAKCWDYLSEIHTKAFVKSREFRRCGMARPKKDNHPVTVRMEEELYNRLNDFCERSGQPKTVALERALKVAWKGSNVGVE